MKTALYYIINKSDISQCRVMRAPYDVALYMLGRRLDNFILVKDDGTPRVIVPTTPNFSDLEIQLEEG